MVRHSDARERDQQLTAKHAVEAKLTAPLSQSNGWAGWVRDDFRNWLIRAA
jgi:hypothetical protein